MDLDAFAYELAAKIAFHCHQRRDEVASIPIPYQTLQPKMVLLSCVEGARVQQALLAALGQSFGVVTPGNFGIDTTKTRGYSPEAHDREVEKAVEELFDGMKRKEQQIHAAVYHAVELAESLFHLARGEDARLARLATRIDVRAYAWDMGNPGQRWLSYKADVSVLAVS